MTTISFGGLIATVSPLKDGYREQIASVTNALARIQPDAVQLSNFNTLGEFTEIMGELMETTQPYTLAYQEA
ncbi:MAG: hypothetical protein AAFQ07_06220 [Chloroflexota bacterium]